MNELPKDPEDNFGEIIKRERNRQELSLSKLSEKLGGLITPSYINRLEAGEKTNPSFIFVCSLATALSLDLREIMKVFGFEHLLKVDLNSPSNTIEEIIRLNTILAPSSVSEQNGTVERDKLSQREKEQLIAVITYIYKFSVDEPSKAIGQLPLIVEQIIKFREIRQEKIQGKCESIEQ